MDMIKPNVPVSITTRTPQHRNFRTYGVLTAVRGGYAKVRLYGGREVVRRIEDVRFEAQPQTQEVQR